MTTRILSPRKPAKPAKTAEKAPPAEAGEIVITRVFDAPRTIVFKTWTDPKHLAAWWGPRGFTNPRCEVDVRAGGIIRIDMRAPNGTVYPMAGIFLEIKEPEQIVFTSGALDDQGVQLFEFLHTVMFADRDGLTELTIRSRMVKTTAGAEKYTSGFKAGMTQSLEKLDGHLTHRGEPIVMDRTFNAPVALVWRALTDRNEFKHWYFDIAEFKAEAGFEFQFTAGCSDKKQFTHLCKITEVVPGRKLAYTWRYAGHPGDSLVTFELTAEGDQTHLKLTHEGLETLPKTPDFARTNFFDGWTMIIGTGLKEYVEKTSQPENATAENKNVSITSDREIIISRVVSAPRELVWDAMTDPRKVVNWWGPVGFSTTIETMEVRPGGIWKHVMRGPDGTNFPNQSVFQEVVKPERIVYSHGGHREGGPGVSFISTWTFETVETNKTKVTIHHVFPTAAQREFVVKEFGAIEGGKQTLGRLDEFVSKIAK